MKVDNRILNIQANVQKLSDKSLIEQTDFLAEHERGITILVLRHLREVEVRRLFADLNYSSMYAYCIKRLKFSESETQSRLSSARLLTELPEIEKQIEDGRLTVTNLSKIQSFVRSEKAAQHGLSKDEKLALVTECENKSTRQVAQELVQRSHQPALLAEKFHVASTSLTDGSLGQVFSKFDAPMDSEISELLQEFKNLYAHELQDGANVTVLTFLLKQAVNLRKKKLGLNSKSDNALPPMAAKVETTIAVTNTKPQAQRKPLSVAEKKYIWKRANACCEYRDKHSGTRCSSKFALQPDHIIALALGGTN